MILFLLSSLCFFQTSLAEETTKKSGDLNEVFRTIERVFSAGKTKGINQLLSGREKTIIVLPELYETTGVFGPSQARLIFKRIFTEFSTLSFRVESKDQASTQTEPIQIRCRWELKRHNGADPIRATLFLRLRSEGRRYVISEIRSAGTGPTRSR